MFPSFVRLLDLLKETNIKEQVQGSEHFGFDATRLLCMNPKAKSRNCHVPPRPRPIRPAHPLEAPSTLPSSSFRFRLFSLSGSPAVRLWNTVVNVVHSLGTLKEDRRDVHQNVLNTPPHPPLLPTPLPFSLPNPLSNARTITRSKQLALRTHPRLETARTRPAQPCPTQVSSEGY